MNWNLGQQYNPDHFIDRCYDMLDGFEEFDEPEYIATGSLHLRHISSVKKLGEAKGLEDLVVLEIEYNTGSDPRVGLTKEIQKVISKLAIEGYRRDHCLAIIKNPNQESYRLSLISFTYNTEKKLVTNAKRFSFLLGPGEKVKTPTDYLIKNTTKIDSIGDLTSRFDVEVVRKEFFNLYINLFLELYQEVKKYQYCFKSVNNGSLIDLVSFSKNLMGKMIFLYFIQKKGWLGLTADQNFKDHPGKHNFFKENFENQTLARDENLFQGGVNFYNDFLEPLFYSGLNKKNPNDWHEKLQMKVPYLNGGLFEEEYKDRETTPLPLENNLFKAIVDAFDTYNFTIDENDPMDQEIAVDPEMLGKIFEYMISINSEKIDALVDLYNQKKKFKEYPSPDRSVNIVAEIKKNKEINKKLGAFYTPREIVQYMTREALMYSMIEFLSKKLTDKSREELEAIVRELRHCKDKHLTTKDEIEDREGQVVTYQTLRSVAFDIMDYLIRNNKNEGKEYEIKPLSILDPAVGSGAFPMGILQEMTGLVEYLIDTFGLEKKSRYEIKQSIIRDSIYGVDIDPGAVDIARLRFWLSLIVDAHEPIPLPNLEFKFVCANSLIPLENDSLFTNKDVIEKLRAIKNEYFRTSDNDKKEDLKMEFQTLKSDLLGFSHKMRHEFKSPKEYKKYIIELVQQNTDAKNRQFQQWEPFDANVSNLWFDSEMMFDTDTFDIVIGNPPYIGYKGNIEIFEAIKKTQLGIKYHHKEMDYRYYFCHLGIDLLKTNGIIGFITTNYWKSAYGATKLRESIKKNGLIALLDFGDNKIFENAEGQHNNIFMVNKRGIQSDVKIFKSKLLSLENILNKDNIITHGSNCFDENNNIYFNNEENTNILAYIKKHKTLIGNKFKVGSGIKTGSDFVSDEHIKKYKLVDVSKGEGIFVLKEQEYTKLVEKGLDPKLLGDFYKSSDIDKFNINSNKYKLLLALDASDIDNKIIFEHLNRFKTILVNRKSGFGKLLGRLDLNFSKNNIALYNNYKKIVAPYRANQNKFAYTENEFYSAEDIYYIYNETGSNDLLKYLTIILNSKLYLFYFRNASKIKGQIMEFTSGVLKKIPFKVPTNKQENMIIGFFDELIKGGGKKIDILVYKLYELTFEDSQIIDPTLTKEEWDKVDFE